MCTTDIQEHKLTSRNATVGKTMLLNKRTLRFRIRFDNEPQFGAQSAITNDSGTITVYNVINGMEAEFCLHELVELTIFDILEEIYPDAPYLDPISDITHFLAGESLNQYISDVQIDNPFHSYLYTDFPPQITDDWVFSQRMESLFWNGQKSGKKSGDQSTVEHGNLEKNSFILNEGKEGREGRKGKNKEQHGKDVKELNLSSIPSNRLEIASYGLSIPKMDTKRKNKAICMTKKVKETIPQVVEENKTQIAQELAISSKVVEKKKKEVRKTKQIKKRLHKKQRKGKSLLTAFRINRMEKRMTLSLNRGEIGHKYA
jgi:hypothetical protein